MAKVRVFVDTNIILEAFRTGCWLKNGWVRSR